MLTPQYRVLNNYWKFDYGKQKGTVSIYADAKNRPCHLRGRILMYDMDVQAINEKLQKCKAEMLLSNPCFEIWLLLHAKDQKIALNTDALLKELKKSAPVWKNYSKSAFTDTQKTFLFSNTEVAVARAKGLREFQNPSTSIYKLIEMLKEVESNRKIVM